MEIFKTLLMVVQVLTALGVIGLVLLQHGKGADVGAAFGSGASGSLFGATGSANFLSRSTAVLATLFFVATLSLTLLGNYRPAASLGVMGAAPRPAPAASAPAVAPASDVPAPVSAPAAPAVPK
ncbi:preprotein translocase subunit SecG [Paracidovorax citrulli]